MLTIDLYSVTITYGPTARERKGWQHEYAVMATSKEAAIETLRAADVCITGQRGQPAVALRLVKSNPPDFAALSLDPRSMAALLAAEYRNAAREGRIDESPSDPTP